MGELQVLAEAALRRMRSRRADIKESIANLDALIAAAECGHLVTYVAMGEQDGFRCARVRGHDGDHEPHPT